MSVRVVERVAERLKTQELRKLENFKKVLGMFGFDGEYLAGHPKIRFLAFLLKSLKKSAVKHSIQKPILLNFGNLFTAFCPGL